MQVVRVLVFANENGSLEYVYFTTDFESDANDFCPTGCELSSDSFLSEEMPLGFPMEYHLQRVSIV